MKPFYIVKLKSKYLMDADEKEIKPFECNMVNELNMFFEGKDKSKYEVYRLNSKDEYILDKICVYYV